jgi:transposase
MAPPAARKAYPIDVTAEEWAVVAPYHTLLDPEAPQRHYDLRDAMTCARCATPCGGSCEPAPPRGCGPRTSRRGPRCISRPNAGSRLAASRRWFTTWVHDLRVLLRVPEDQDPDPTVGVLDGRTLRSMPVSGHRAGYDDHRWTKGSRVHAVVDTPGHLLAVRITPPRTRRSGRRERVALPRLFLYDSDSR